MKSLEERQALANQEMWKTARWFSEEIDRINDELDEKFGDERTIDGNREAFAETHRKFAERMKAIGEKYNLPKAQ